MKNAFLLIGISLSAVINVIAETEVEKEVKQLILDDNACALKNLEDKAKMISKNGSLEFWSSGGLLHSLKQNSKVRDQVWMYRHSNFTGIAGGISL